MNENFNCSASCFLLKCLKFLSAILFESFFNAEKVVLLLG